MRHLFPLLVLLAACAPSARRVELAPGVVMEPGRALALWHGNTSDTLHAVQLTDSIVSGIPLGQLLECDSCRVNLPLTGVDAASEVSARRDRLMPVALSAAAIAAFAGIWLWSDHQ